MRLKFFMQVNEKVLATVDIPLEAEKAIEWMEMTEEQRGMAVVAWSNTVCVEF